MRSAYTYGVRRPKVGKTERDPDYWKKEMWKFHRKYPYVYDMFEEVVMDLISLGHKNYSSDAILHHIRFTINKPRPENEFKINNNYTPYYARYFIYLHPENEGFFETRKVGSRIRKENQNQELKALHLKY